MGKTPEERGRRTENDRKGRPPWRERHGKDGRRHGEQKKKDGGKETPAKKNGDGARRKTGAEGGKGRNRGGACRPAMQGPAM